MNHSHDIKAIENERASQGKNNDILLAVEKVRSQNKIEKYWDFK